MASAPEAEVCGGEPSSSGTLKESPTAEDFPGLIASRSPDSQVPSVCRGGPGVSQCGLEVTDNQQGVQCDLCLNWYHTQCQDLTKAAYNALKRYSLISFICSSCKKSPNLNIPQPKLEAVVGESGGGTAVRVPDGPGCPTPTVSGGGGVASRPKLADSATQTDEILNSLSQRMSHIESALNEHSRAVSESIRVIEKSQDDMRASLLTISNSVSQAGSLKEQGPWGGRGNGGAQYSGAVRPVPSPQTAPDSHEDYRKMMREELRELEERKKRRASLVIRGLQVSTPTEAAAKFGEITSMLIGERAILSEVCRIKSDSDLFRGNVHDERVRRLILEQSRKLKDSAYSMVYIRRDLTYSQREELKARYNRQHSLEETIPKRAPSPLTLGDFMPEPFARGNSYTDGQTLGRQRPDGPPGGNAPPPEQIQGN